MHFIYRFPLCSSLAASALFLTLAGEAYAQPAQTAQRKVQEVSSTANNAAQSAADSTEIRLNATDLVSANIYLD